MAAQDELFRLIEYRENHKSKCLWLREFKPKTQTVLVDLRQIWAV